MRHLVTLLLSITAVLVLLATRVSSASPSSSSSSSSSSSPSAGESDGSLQTGASSARHKRESDSKVDLEAFKDNLAAIEDGLAAFQKRSCAVGLNSHHCAIAHLDDLMMGSDYLRGGFSPGKRSTELPEDVRTQAEILLDNLSAQKEAVGTLRALLSQLGARVEKQARKRNSCAIRLANHCLTEALDRAANQYFYLQSHHSPGRRRRDAGGLTGTAAGKSRSHSLLKLTSYGRKARSLPQSSEGRSALQGQGQLLRQ